MGWTTGDEPTKPFSKFYRALGYFRVSEIVNHNSQMHTYFTSTYFFGKKFLLEKISLSNRPRAMFIFIFPDLLVS